MNGWMDKWMNELIVKPKIFVDKLTSLQDVKPSSCADHIMGHSARQLRQE